LVPPEPPSQVCFNAFYSHDFTFATNVLSAELHSTMASLQQPKGAAQEKLAFTAWLRDQMALPPSLHRSYYRRRANPRIFEGLVLPTGFAGSACVAGSRWHRYAFTDEDRGRTVFAVLSPAGIFSLSVDGELRTVVSEAQFLTGLTRNTSTSFMICTKQPGAGGYLQEWVGGMLRLSPSNCATGTTSDAALNPAIAFADTLPATLLSFSVGEITLRTIPASWGVNGEDDVLLKSVGAVCNPNMKYFRTSADGKIYHRCLRPRSFFPNTY
jgi:hypothetical protein